MARRRARVAIRVSAIQRQEADRLDVSKRAGANRPGVSVLVRDQFYQAARAVDVCVRDSDWVLAFVRAVPVATAFLAGSGVEERLAGTSFRIREPLGAAPQSGRRVRPHIPELVSAAD